VTIVLFDIFDSARMAEACTLRVAVFVDEQGVPAEEEVDDHDRSDATAVHAVAYGTAGEPLGAGRFFDAGGGRAQIGRMAVARRARGTGVGRAILEALIAEAARRGYARAHLHAQLHARHFYLAAGFEDDGALFWDGGIEHRPMSKPLGRKELLSDS